MIGDKEFILICMYIMGFISGYILKGLKNE